MIKLAYVFFLGLLCVGLGSSILGCSRGNQVNKETRSINQHVTYKINELRKIRKKIEGTEIRVKGYLYKGGHSWVWLCQEASENVNRENSLQLADFPFDLKDNTWSREVIVVGRYGCLDEELGFDVLAPIKFIDINP